MNNKWNKNILQLGVMLALAGCACILFAEVIKQWKSIFAFFGNVISAMTPIIIGLVIAFMLNPIMIYIRRGLSFLICKIRKEAEYDTIYRKVKVPALILTVLLFLGLLVGLLWLVIPRVYESLTEKSGAVAEQFIFQELSSRIPYLYYWVSGATARVPFVYEGENAPVPVDIRFVPNSKAQNIKTFRSKNPNTNIMVKVSFNQVSMDGNVLNIPAYGLWNM